MIFDYLLRVCGGAFFLAFLIGLVCLAKHLWGEVGRCKGMSWRGLLIGDWTPGVQFDRWYLDWQWREEEK